jgi:hypothetical protein
MPDRLRLADVAPGWTGRNVVTEEFTLAYALKAVRSFGRVVQQHYGGSITVLYTQYDIDRELTSQYTRRAILTSCTTVSEDKTNEHATA